MRPMRRLLIAIVIGQVIGSLVAVVLAENALHIKERRPPRESIAEDTARSTGAAWSTIQVYYVVPEAGGEKTYALLFSTLKETAHAGMGSLAV